MRFFNPEPDTKPVINLEERNGNIFIVYAISYIQKLKLYALKFINLYSAIVPNFAT